MLGFEIGPREGGEKNGQTDRLTYVDFNIDPYDNFDNSQNGRLRHPPARPSGARDCLGQTIFISSSI